MDAIATTLRVHRRIRNLALVVCALGILAASLVAWVPTAFGLSPSALPYGITAIIVFFLASIPALIAVTSLRVKDLLGDSSPYMIGEQLSHIAEERKVLEKRLADE